MPENGYRESELIDLTDLELRTNLKKELQGFLTLLQRPGTHLFSDPAP